MIDLLRFILTNIVDHPEDIHIDTAADAAGTTIFNLTVHPEDMGKVIGKGGQIITAIRELAKIKAAKLNQRVKVILIDPQVQPPDLPQTDPLGQPELSAIPPQKSEN